MSQGSQVASPTQSSPRVSLNPVLQAALGSLDVDIEEELARYRRQVADTQAMPPREGAIAIEGETPASVEQMLPTGEDTLSTTFAQTYSPTHSETPPPPSPDLVYPPPAPTPTVDNLASSEQLLRSLAESEAQIPFQERRIAAKLLTPLGVGLMLLLLLSGATFGYMAMNQASRSYLESHRNRRTPTPAEPESNSAKSTAEPPIPNGPNLAADEFVDLNLNNLSTLKTSPSQSPATVPPALTAQAATQAAIPRLDGKQRPQDLAPTLLSPAQKQDDVYYVLTDYKGDRSLAQAKQIAADAYVLKLPEGNRIQIAAFLKESEAQEFVKKVQQQGIAAWVYRP